MKLALRLLVLLAASLAVDGMAQLKSERALYLSGNQTLQGVIYRPKGPGPFPAVVFNQSTPKAVNQGKSADVFPELAKIFVNKGYIFFVPGRHLPGKVEPEDKPMLKDLLADNIVAAVAWVKAQHDVDDKRVAVIGDSAGAVSTLFAVGKGMDVRAVVLFLLPSGRNLTSHPQFQYRLTQSMEESTAPIYLIQLQHEGNFSAQKVFGPILERKGAPSALTIYPLFGEGQSDSPRFVVDGCGVWQRDVTSYLSKVMN